MDKLLPTKEAWIVEEARKNQDKITVVAKRIDIVSLPNECYRNVERTTIWWGEQRTTILFLTFLLPVVSTKKSKRHVLTSFLKIL